MPSPLGATLLVAAGGAAGSVARFLVSQALAGRVGSAGLPLGTLIVNVVGSLVLGLVLGLAPARPDGAARLLVGVGICGGFTTFSTFSAEVLMLVERGGAARAAGYAVGSVVAGVLATLLGFTLARALAHR